VLQENNSLVALFFDCRKMKGEKRLKKVGKRLNFQNRQRIESMMQAGEKVVVIAEAVGVHRATIYQELKRGGTPYRADVAQRTFLPCHNQ
jgi:IS30 family transposase